MTYHPIESQQRSALSDALGGFAQVPENWMSATAVHPLFYEDPGQIWLRFHGSSHGLLPSPSAYHFIDFIGEKGRQLETAWVQAMLPEAPRVCQDPREVRSAGKVEETWDLISRGVPAVVQPALWWAPEQLYGVPDLIVHSEWLFEHFPDLLPDAGPPHYIVIDFKFTSNLAENTADGRAYAAQVRTYSYMLGHLQGTMPERGFLVPRDRLFNPLPVTVRSQLGRPLDQDIAEMRDRFLKIKLEGHRSTPWTDPALASNPKHSDDYWNAAKHTIAWDRVDGVDPCVLPWITPKQRRQLASLGFHSLRDLLAVPVEDVPLERCDNLGAARCRNLRTILQAARSRVPIPPSPSLVPAMTRHELMVDFEYFSNANVDFERQWPGLEGHEMIFMIGAGWVDHGAWRFKVFTAAAETLAGERILLDEFVDFLATRAGDSLHDPTQTTLYHWSPAENWQSKRAGSRHGLPADHGLWNLPWFDLEKQVAVKAPIGLPDAWDTKVKSVARALAKIDPIYDPRWPEDLDEGKNAMVMGWRAYEQADPLRTPEMALLTDYLEADCRALLAVLRWMRDSATRSSE